MKDYRNFIREEILRQGRNPDDTKVLFLIAPIVGATEEEAQLRARLRNEQARERAIQTLADTADRMNVDLAKLPLDEVLDDDVIDSTYTAASVPRWRRSRSNCVAAPCVSSADRWVLRNRSGWARPTRLRAGCRRSQTKSAATGS
ncbi:FMN-dependent oxidoreductase, nitrilotriacetate monooxygenase family [Rhodococcus rhodochrous]|uniref:hypothetical protein n=1 Tax=Rhodococcus rhodochrous TaxID=1829 RepID=UPI0007510D98|nr:hypothetical protein [Rhodococcus rhodochrous]MDO1486813.1 hypothetical protein [Rhodococcus rhodochrous]SNV16027.1 FMN-dependent oxidoreductase, nitrilotriacetate monooxygenase family [Rhodococcus rhodochrous]